IIHKGALLSHRFTVDGRVLDGRWTNGIISSNTEYYFKKDPKHTNYFGLTLDYGRDLIAERKLVLGGENGLRGYPRNLQEGDSRFLFTYEKRLYYDVHVMRLFYIANVVFFDIGRAWSRDDTYSNNQGVLKDIGVGLRLMSSKSGKNQVYHLDFAIPLDGNDALKTYQVTATAESSF
ncbi:MAG: hypothetical protein ACC707_20155, partial [Thiohalomonadales bacterium]